MIDSFYFRLLSAQIAIGGAFVALDWIGGLVAMAVFWLVFAALALRGD